MSTRSAERTAAEQLCRVWVRAYTARLPAEEAVRRRAEVDSDLWEHAADARASGMSATALTIDVLGRVLSGAPADLMWRRAIRQRPLARPAPGGVPVKKSSLELPLFIVTAVGIGICLTWIPILGTGGATGSSIRLGVLVLLGGALLAAGLVVRNSRPTASTVLLLVGAIGPGLAWYWMPPVYLVSIAIAVLALVTARRPVDATAAT